ncbi:MAG TPA: hypothetical protein VHI52_20650, partial [Verrucomicrobiae bacterium]|nr:hypothetical protein [Verrucomicrobiae bacterium]
GAAPAAHAPAPAPARATAAPVAAAAPRPVAATPRPAPVVVSAPTVSSLDKMLAIAAAVIGLAAVATTAYVIWMLPN